jgi:hypothetical protein
MSCEKDAVRSDRVTTVLHRPRVFFLSPPPSSRSIRLLPHVPGGGGFSEECRRIPRRFGRYLRFSNSRGCVRVPDSEKRLSSGAISRHPREEQCRSWRGKMHRGTSRCSALLVLDETTSTEQRARVAQHSRRTGLLSEHGRRFSPTTSTDRTPPTYHTVPCSCSSILPTSGCKHRNCQSEQASSS